MSIHHPVRDLILIGLACWLVWKLICAVKPMIVAVLTNALWSYGAYDTTSLTTIRFLIACGVAVNGYDNTCFPRTPLTALIEGWGDGLRHHVTGAKDKRKLLAGIQLLLDAQADARQIDDCNVTPRRHLEGLIANRQYRELTEPNKIIVDEAIELLKNAELDAERRELESVLVPGAASEREPPARRRM